jgi:hypothetical protein
MRRGLIHWSKDEVPAAVLDARLARFQAAMAAERLDAALLHTSFPRPAAVSYLTHFVPYWSEALLLVLPSGPPLLFAALSKRVHGWIREVSHLGEIVSAPKPGEAAARLLEQRLKGPARVGIVDLDALPFDVAEPLVGALGRAAVVDASAAFAAVRQPPDAAEVALAERAAAMAADALRHGELGGGRAGEVLAAIERPARAAGAEEATVYLCPDLGAGRMLRRTEGETALGSRFAAQLALAYKGVWVRLARSFAPGAERPRAWIDADRWLADAVATLDAATLGDDARRIAPPGRLVDWTIEACLGAVPLTAVAASDLTAARSLPAGALAVITVRLDTDAGPWIGGLPFILGGGGKPGRGLIGG